MERYSRNILINDIGTEGQNLLLDSKILVAGAGGLGSTVITSLACMGIGSIGIIDDDLVELSNLNRQYIHNIKKISEYKTDSAQDWVKNFNPDIEIKAYRLRFDSSCSDILKYYDIVIDCFDSYNSKFVLNDACVKENKIFIHGGVSEFYGQVLKIIPGKTACLRCLFPDKKDLPSEIKGVISPSVSTIGSIQSMEVLKHILKLEESSLEDTLLCFDGLKQDYKKIQIYKNEKCSICN